MTVSIAMATCDGEQFLAEQLASIAEQTAPPHDVVVCDDASSDGTASVVERFAADAPFPVTLHRNEKRLGVGENFIRAAMLCSGDLIAFADQDDVWRAEKLERCVGALTRHDARLVVHACEVVDDALRPLGRVVPKIPSERVSEAQTTPRWAEAPGMAMVFDRDLLSLLPWDRRPRAHHAHGRLLHDEWVLALARLEGRTVYLPDRLVLYRQHGVNVEGAPQRGLGPQLSEAASVGADYYARRAAQARDWAELLSGGGFAAEGESWARLAAALDLRVAAHSPERGRRQRLAAVATGLRRGAYGSRRSDGFGLRGLARDALLAAAGR